MIRSFASAFFTKRNKVNSDMNPEKRKRDPTFLASEKMLLVNIMYEHISVIESRRTDSITCKAKLERWQVISEEFNRNSPVMERDWQVLRNLWDNLKKKAKCSITVTNQNNFATGGGPQKKFKDDPVVEKVISLIHNNVSGFKNVYDSDGLSTVSVPFEDPSKNETCKESNVAQVLINGDWSTYTPSLLRTPRAPVLRDIGFVEADVGVVNATTAVIDNVEESSCTAPSTLPTCPPSAPVLSSRHLTSRRRPAIRESEAALLAQCKVKTLEITTEQATQQHELTMKILKLQEEQEIEKLKQEKERTEQERLKTLILQEQLRKAKEE